MRLTHNTSVRQKWIRIGALKSTVVNVRGGIKVGRIRCKNPCIYAKNKLMALEKLSVIAGVKQKGNFSQNNS